MFFAYALIFVATVSQIHSEKSAVLVLSFDGFKPEYFNTNSTPFLYGLKDKSARPPYMTSVFPTKTFVTHFSLATGVSPGVHGVYGNTMFDKNGEIIFNTQEQFQTNKKIVPIWIENQKAGGTSGVMMWPGSEFEYDGKIAEYHVPYDEKLDWDNRAEKIIDWMSREDKRANLVMAYFEDTPIYNSTKKTSKINEHCEKIDNTIKKIYKGLEAKITSGDLDMIILSDHGTRVVKYTHILNADKLISNYDQVKKIVSGPNVFFKIDDKNLRKSAFNQMIMKFDRKYKYKVYRYEDLPEGNGLKTCPNLEGMIFVFAESGNTFYEESTLKDLVQINGGVEENFITFENGYDVNDNEMKSFFVGIGPKFQDNLITKESFGLLDVYPMLKKLLGLNEPASDVQQNTALNEAVKLLLMDNVVNS